MGSGSLLGQIIFMILMVKFLPPIVEFCIEKLPGITKAVLDNFEG